MTETCNLLFNILLIGDDNVGKTSIFHRFMEGSFTLYTIATIGM